MNSGNWKGRKQKMTVINIRIEVQNDDGSKAYQDIIIPASVVDPTKDEEVKPLVADEVVVKKVEKAKAPKPVKEVSLDEIRSWATNAIEAKLGDKVKEIMESFNIKKLSEIEDRTAEEKRDLFESISALTKPF